MVLGTQVLLGGGKELSSSRWTHLRSCFYFLWVPHLGSWWNRVVLRNARNANSKFLAILSFWRSISALFELSFKLVYLKENLAQCACINHCALLWHMKKKCTSFSRPAGLWISISKRQLVKARYWMTSEQGQYLPWLSLWGQNLHQSILWGNSTQAAWKALLNFW